MAKHLIVNALGFMMILSLAACSSNPIAPPAKVITQTEYVTPPAPIVSKPDQLALRKFEFIIITPENIDEVFAELKDDTVLFAITKDGYENLALNISDIRAFISQQKKIIAIYEAQWEQ